MSTPAVRLDSITKRFPGVVANDDIDLTIERGTVHALLGENGAGKTTLMNVLYGLFDPTSGGIHVDGERREFDSPQDAIDAGIGMIHQHFMLVGPMSVADNVVLGNEPTKWGGLAVDRDAAREAVRDLGERYGFEVDPEAKIEDVSVGVRQRVEILKALYRGAEVLILDEPTAVLTPQEVEELFDVISELTDQGKTVIFITHKLGEAMESADEITVLRDGENVGTVDADGTSREELARMMVGREVLFDAEVPERTAGDPVLSASDLAVEEGDARPVDGIDLTVHEGEILGVAGVDGNGQAELVEAMTGLRTPDEGRVEMTGEDVTDVSRQDLIQRGMAYIPEDRQERGLVMDFDLVQNGLLGRQRLEQFAPSGMIDWRRGRADTEQLLEEYDVRPRNPDATATSLSGGNQQKFVVGRELSRDPDVLVAAQPTRGVDVGSVEFVHEQLLELRDEGVGILLVSSKLDEVQRLSDRLAVIHDGEFMAITDPDNVTEEDLGLLMAGEEPDRAATAATGVTDDE